MKPSLTWIARLMQCFEPRKRPHLGAWLERHVLMPEGDPWSLLSYPHLHAPGGPIEAYRDDAVRTIWLQFGSRLGKTAFGHGTLLYQAAVDPCPMLFGSATEKLVHRSVQTKIYPMVERCDVLRDQLRPRSRRQNTLVELRHCRIFCAWSGSQSQLADLSARVAHANEIDKWDTTVSTEADPLKLFDERSKEFPQHKRIKESTPTIMGSSRVERGVAGSDNRAYWCPCPRCGGWQVLDFGGPDVPHGVKWPAGSTAEQARTGSHYVCLHCAEAIGEEQRPQFVRGGVWIPEGQEPDAEGKPVGEPLRPGTEAGFQLGSLAALKLGWGDYAGEFLRCKDNPWLLRNFVNSWEGKTWEEHKSETTTALLASRLCVDRPAGVVPEQSIFLTCGIDVQQSHLVFVVVGWGLAATGSVIRWGFVPDFATLAREVLDAPYVDTKKQWRYRIARALIDCGYETDRVYDFVRGRFAAGDGRLLPCKGTDATRLDESYRTVKADGGIPRIDVHTNHWQTIVQRAFDRLRPGDPGSLDFPAEARDDEDFLAQLLNEMPSERTDAKNYTKRIWIKRREGLPNDFRDALRYARVAAEMTVGRAWPRLLPEFRSRSADRLGEAVEVASATVTATAPKPGGFRLPDGRPFLLTDRLRQGNRR